MTGKNEYERWLASPVITVGERDELTGIGADEIESRFYAPLSFGTAGLRGVMGAGINRMNARVVAQTTRALAELVRESGGAGRGIVICHDCRQHSREFAETAACAAAELGVRALLFDSLRPTPELSFAIRLHGACAGINITASHNPREYNGYKVYWSDGAQLPPEAARKVSDAMDRLDILAPLPKMTLAEATAAGLLTVLGAETDQAFLQAVLSQCIDRDAVEKAAGKIRIVYSAFHGAGYRLVPEALRRSGVKGLVCVEEQMVPDGAFPTVKSPNPENPEGFALSLEYARRCGAELVMGTDPDSDRFACMALSGGDYRVITGNQLGVLLLDYMINARRRMGLMPEKPAAIKSLVTTDMARVVAEASGVRMEDTFTGFKFLAEKLGELEKDGYTVLLSYEEAIGYLIGSFARDKDGVTAAVMTAEMASWYFNRGMTLIDALDELYKKYGWFSERTVSLVMPGIDGIERMKKLMRELRAAPPSQISGISVLKALDYADGSVKSADGGVSEAPMKGANVLRFYLDGGAGVIVRPSGTEPKIKIYLFARGGSAGDCARTLETLGNWELLSVGAGS